MRPACLLLSILFLAPACAATRADSAVLATLERTQCLGHCPVYKVTVYSDGRVEWNGVVCVKVEGQKSAMLTAAELHSLREAFAAASYFKLDDSYTCLMTDAPLVVTSFRDGRRTKTIVHNKECPSMRMDALTELESTFERIVKSERWLGAEEERLTPNDVLRKWAHAVRDDPNPAVQKHAYEQLLRYLAPERKVHFSREFNRDRDVDWELVRSALAD
jgi:hypothetical protein